MIERSGALPTLRSRSDGPRAVFGFHPRDNSGRIESANFVQVQDRAKESWRNLPPSPDKAQSVGVGG